MIIRIIRSIKSRIKNILFNFCKYFKKPFSYRLLNGKKIKLYPNGQIAKGIYNGGFERVELKLFQNIIHAGMNIVDVGANIGLYSIIASKMIGLSGKVWAFEPSQKNFNLLQQNLQLDSHNNVIPINLGLGDKVNENLTLRMDVGYGDAEKYIEPENHIPDINLENVDKINTVEKVELTTLDAFMEIANVNTVDFVKIDTEGYEYFILKGASKIISLNPQIIILMECTRLGNERMGISQDDVFSLLLDDYGLNIFYWNYNRNCWSNDLKGLKNAGNIWVCQNINQLSVL